MTLITEAGTMRVLAAIKSGHPKMETGDATIKFWTAALQAGGVTNVEDAIQAVVLHYATPGANPWIIPGDVIGHYRELRWERIKDIQDGQLTPDLSPDAPMRVYTKTMQARAAAVENGMPIAQAIATVPPVLAIEATK